jgi:hypothetical protein
MAFMGLPWPTNKTGMGPVSDLAFNAATMEERSADMHSA